MGGLGKTCLFSAEDLCLSSGGGEGGGGEPEGGRSAEIKEGLGVSRKKKASMLSNISHQSRSI